MNGTKVGTRLPHETVHEIKDQRQHDANYDRRDDREVKPEVLFLNHNIAR